jgi:hypothetical protein
MASGLFARPASWAASDAELRTTFAELLERRASDPGDDLVSALVAEQGRAIGPTELSALVRLLLIAGFETTVNMRVVLIRMPAHLCHAGPACAVVTQSALPSTPVRSAFHEHRGTPLRRDLIWARQA